MVKAVWLAALFALLAQLAWAECVQVERIVIARDGSVEPLDAPVERVGDVYRLTASVCSRKGLVVEASNVVIEGGGFVLAGMKLQGSAGVQLVHVRNVTVRNLSIHDFYYGMRVEFSEGVSLEELNVSGCAEGVSVANSTRVGVVGSRFYGNVLGVSTLYSRSFEISNCAIEGGYWGVFASHSPGVRVIGCTISNSSWGVLLLSSHRSTIAWNSFEGTGFYPFESFELTVANNTVNGKPLVYLEGVEGVEVRDAGQIVVVSSNRVAVVGVNVSRTSVGIALIRTNNSLVESCNVAESRWGVLVHGAKSSRVANCIIARNEVGLYLYESSGGEFSGNLLLFNGVGLRLAGSSGNLVWRNCLVANRVEAEVAGGQGNLLDWGPNGGNYWSAHYAEDANRDGVLDQPYPVGAGNVDRYPLASCPLALKLPEPAPSCRLRLEVNESVVSKVEAGATGVVKVSVSGALPLKAVCFAIGNISTGWFRWDRSENGWDALSKTLAVKLPTPGTHVMKAEVRDAAGRPATCETIIHVEEAAAPKPPPPAGWRPDVVSIVLVCAALLALSRVLKHRKRVAELVRGLSENLRETLLNSA